MLAVAYSNQAVSPAKRLRFFNLLSKHVTSITKNAIRIPLAIRKTIAGFVSTGLSYIASVSAKENRII
jgi:hypothetical protein